MERWSVTEIAKYYEISKQLAYKWTRHSEFPEPVETPARGRQWSAEHVIAWGVAHGRSKGCGPRSHRGGSRWN